MKLTKTEEDLNLYGDKCNFYIDKKNRTVVCATTYKGESIRGVAKCDPADDFNIDVGKVLAYARCRQKLAKKKLAHSKRVYAKALADEMKAKNNVMKAFVFMHDSEEYLKNSNKELNELNKRLGE